MNHWTPKCPSPHQLQQHDNKWLGHVSLNTKVPPPPTAAARHQMTWPCFSAQKTSTNDWSQRHVSKQFQREGDIWCVMNLSSVLSPTQLSTFQSPSPTQGKVKDWSLVASLLVRMIPIKSPPFNWSSMEAVCVRVCSMEGGGTTFLWH